MSIQHIFWVCSTKRLCRYYRDLEIAKRGESETVVKTVRFDDLDCEDEMRALGHDYIRSMKVFD